MGFSIRRKRLQRAAAGLLAVFSPALYALGLGDAHVQSFLGQPLEVRIDLISQSESELAAVSAGLASAEDFRMIGLSRAALSVPLQFQVNGVLPEPYIRASSTLPVNDPVVQFVVEVKFPGGRMLREYTLFLDPPTFAAPVPPPAITPSRTEPATQEPARQSAVEAPAPEVEISAIEDPAATVPAAAAPEGVEPELVESPAVEAAPLPETDTLAADAETDDVGSTVDELAETPGETDVPAADDGGPAEDATLDEAAAEAGEPAPDGAEESPETSAPDAEPAGEAAQSAAEEQAPAAEEPPEPQQAPPEQPPAPEYADEPVPEPAPVVYQAPAYSGETYGPVASGETMWAIASKFVAGTGYSINQAMLAIQRHNPEAFIGNNINSLKRGAILRLPELGQVGALSSRAAMLEAMRQEEEYRARREGRPESPPPPAIADAALEGPDAQVAAPDADVTAAKSAVVGRLELVPPTEMGDAAGAGQGGPDASGAGNGPGGGTSDQALDRSEEELANARQENEYLNARIRELEAQLADRGGTVTDPGLAELEQALREERLSGAAEEPLAVVPPREEPAWYTGKTWWVTGLLVLLLAGAVWLLRRFRGAVDSEAETVSTIKDEAEEVLRVLADGDEKPGSDADNVINLERYVEPGHANEAREQDPVEPRPPETEPEDTGDAEHGQEQAEAEGEDEARLSGSLESIPEQDSTESEEESGRPGDDEEAVELDADDPETKLDLARAYISMGDNEAALAMLREVIEEGNEDQVSEARYMMTEI